jgi:hypothetical protein
MLIKFIFALGWLLFVAGQAQNSIRSSSNSLEGWSGLVTWLRLQAVNLVTRAFFSALLYPVLVSDMSSKLQAVGLSLTALGVAGFAGYGANAGLYQLLGFLPFFRAEIPELAPAAKSGSNIAYAIPTSEIDPHHVQISPTISGAQPQKKTGE